MDPNNPFGFDYTAPDGPSSGNSPDYAPSPHIQQEKELQEWPPQSQNISASAHTDPNNLLGLGFGNGGGGLSTAPNDTFTRLMDRAAAEEAQQQQQDTIMSSHTDPNLADIPDNDPSEIERIRSRYARHEEKLKIMETLGERDAVPGGRVGKRGGEYRRGAMDFGDEEDDHFSENIDEDYGNGAWEVREERQFNRYSSPTQNDHEQEGAEQSGDESDGEYRRRVHRALLQIKDGRGDTTGFKELQRNRLRRQRERPWIALWQFWQ